MDFSQNVYLVNFTVGGNMCFDNVRVVESSIRAQGFDVLIGMDIISQGDFCVSNYRGRTVFTFRIPSQGVIDFMTVSEDDVCQKSLWTKRNK